MTTDKSRADALTAQVALAAIEMLETGREYRFDGAVPNAKRDGVLPAWWRRPSIFMPSTAARTLFEVPGVCVERLQSISDVNAISEGIERTSDGFSVDGSRHFPAARARDSFASLWGGINAEAGHGGGDTNPLLWVVEFRRITPRDGDRPVRADRGQSRSRRGHAGRDARDRAARRRPHPRTSVHRVRHACGTRPRAALARGDRHAAH